MYHFIDHMKWKELLRRPFDHGFAQELISNAKICSTKGTLNFRATFARVKWRFCAKKYNLTFFTFHFFPILYKTNPWRNFWFERFNNVKHVKKWFPNPAFSGWGINVSFNKNGLVRCMTIILLSCMLFRGIEEFLDALEVKNRSKFNIWSSFEIVTD